MNEHFNRGTVTNIIGIERPLNLYGLNTNPKILKQALPILENKGGFEKVFSGEKIHQEREMKPP